MLHNDLYNDSTDKFKQVLHYVIHKTSNISNVGKTVLYKILYFTDFNYYELFEEKLTGEAYIRYPLGPAPQDFEKITHMMEQENLITETERYYSGRTQIKYKSNSEPDTSKLNQDELDFIDQSIEKYSCFSAREISDHSHLDTPYIAAEDFKEIDYEMVFYRTSELSVREYSEDDD